MIIIIDIHSHIIFGVDDGPNTLEESINMLKIAIDQGITDIIGTSHYGNDRFSYNIDKLKNNFMMIQERIKKENLEITLYLGNEIYLNEETLDSLKNNKCFTLANSKYILIELNGLENFFFFKKLIFNLGCSGYIPIIAHCERLIKSKNDYRKILKLKEMGCYLQVDADFFINSRKKLLKKLVINQLKKGVISFIASDTHGIEYRPNNLCNVYYKLGKKIGQERIDKIMIENPQKILNKVKHL